MKSGPDYALPNPTTPLYGAVHQRSRADARRVRWNDIEDLQRRFPAWWVGTLGEFLGRASSGEWPSIKVLSLGTDQIVITFGTFNHALLSRASDQILALRHAGPERGGLVLIEAGTTTPAEFAARLAAYDQDDPLPTPPIAIRPRLTLLEL